MRKANISVFLISLAVIISLANLVGIVLVIALLLLPLSVKKSGSVRDFNITDILQLLYFIFIGAGFMLFETPLIDNFTTLLGSPVYSFAFVIGSLLLFSSIGSLLGRPFTTALKLLKIRNSSVGIPWAYALNGAASVMTINATPILVRIVRVKELF